jgi:hypothetical protein
MTMLKFSAAQDVRTEPNEFMDFWACMNDELASHGAKEAFYDDAKDAFDNSKQTPSEAAKHLMKVRGES